MGADNEEKKGGGEEEQKPITAGYRPLWGQHGLLAMFWTLITFPLGFLGLLLLSPMFILVIILSLGLFVGGAVMIELEQRDPRIFLDLEARLSKYFSQANVTSGARS
ncbi:hypothetical protein ACHWQZ_G008770 [Mnemiopsis leidyi]